MLMPEIRKLLFKLLTRANGFFKLESEFRLQIVRSLCARGRACAFESLLELFDFASESAALGTPLVPSFFELILEIVLKFFLISEPLFVLRLHLLNELLGRGFGPGDRIQIDGFVFPLELAGPIFADSKPAGLAALRN